MILLSSSYRLVILLPSSLVVLLSLLVGLRYLALFVKVTPSGGHRLLQIEEDRFYLPSNCFVLGSIALISPRLYICIRTSNRGMSSESDSRAMSFNEVIEELISYRSGQLRTGSQDIPRVKELLVWLRRSGYKPEQIEEMTRGLWKVSTIKHYTKGVRAASPPPAATATTKTSTAETITTTTTTAKNPSSPEAGHLSVVADMAANNIGLEEVKQGILVHRAAKANNLTVEEVASFIAAARDSVPGGAPALIFAVGEAVRSGVAMGEIGPTVGYKKSLAKVGIEGDDNGAKKLGRLHDLITKQGKRDFHTTIQLIEKFDGLESLQSDMAQLEGSKKASEQKVGSLHAEVEALEKKKEAVQFSLDLYAWLEGQGFTSEVLAKLKESATRYCGGDAGDGGTEGGGGRAGPLDQLLDAINKYGGLAELRAEIEKTRAALRQEQGRFDRLRVEHLHEQYLLSMCDTLLQFGYNIPAIERIAAVAKKYGEPLAALKALDSYGGLAEIEAAPQKARDYDRAKQELGDALEEIKRLDAKVADYEQVKRERDEAQAKLAEQDRRSVNILQDTLVQLEIPKDQRNYDGQLAASGLAELVEKQVEDAVAKRLKDAGNRALVARFADEVKSQAERYLRVWSQNDLGTRTPQKIKALEQLHLENPFVALKGQWPVECYLCESTHTLTLQTVYDIREILINGHVRVSSDIVSSLAAAGRKHSTPAQLKDLVWLYIRKALRAPSAAAIDG